MSINLKKLADMSSSPGIWGRLVNSPFVKNLPNQEGRGDLLGLGAMGISSLDKLQAGLRGDEERKSLLGGTAGRSALDLVGLGFMGAPTAAALATRQGNLARHALNMGGLGALGVSTLDKLQAGMRARDPEDIHHKMLLSHGAHKALEVGGMGAMAIPYVGDLADQIGDIRNDAKSMGFISSLKKNLPVKSGVHAALAAAAPATGLAGYGEFIRDVTDDDDDQGPGKPKKSPIRHSARELAGLGLLAASTLGHLGGHLWKTYSMHCTM